MAKFRTRETVDAQQWEPGVPMEGVTKTGGGYGVVNTPMGNVEVKPGFWVVTDRDGKRHVMNPAAFEGAFEPAPQNVEFPHSEGNTYTGHDGGILVSRWSSHPDDVRDNETIAPGHFDIGALVRLASGGPPMLVEGFTEERDKTLCLWADGEGKGQSKWFETPTLRPSYATEEEVAKLLAIADPADAPAEVKPYETLDGKPVFIVEDDSGKKTIEVGDPPGDDGDE